LKQSTSSRWLKIANALVSPASFAWYFVDKAERRNVLTLNPDRALYDLLH